MNNPKLKIYKKNKIFDKSSESEIQKSNKKLGRKLKEESPLNQKITVNFTKNERKKLEELSEKNQGVSLTTLIRNACKKQKII